MANVRTGLLTAAAPQPPATAIGTQTVALTGHHRGTLVRGRDPINGGAFRFAGIVDVVAVPAPSRRVWLHIAATGQVVREAWSASDGAFAFRGMADQPYFATAFDNPGGFDPTISPILRPSAAP